MERIRADDVLDLVAYEKARDTMLARIIQLKTRRRISLGDNLTLLFENRDTVLFQIQEMVRTERIVKEEAVAQEVETYNALIPDPGELSATRTAASSCRIRSISFPSGHRAAPLRSGGRSPERLMWGGRLWPRSDGEARY